MTDIQRADSAARTTAIIIIISAIVGSLLTVVFDLSYIK